MVGRQLDAWRERLLDVAAAVEAGLDFADEEDIPADVTNTAAAEMDALATEMAQALAGARSGERLRDGFTVVLAGPPNAGKSTLLNLFARREVAIVSATSGTTRDVIEVRCDLAGLPVTFVDTAGIRASDDPVEQEGIARARRRADSADLLLWLTDAAGPPDDEPADLAASVLRVWTKVDLARAPALDGIAVSAHRGDGMEELLAAILARARADLGEGGDLIVRERHEQALRDVVSALSRGREMASGGRPELAAEDIRLALAALGTITGEVGAEDVLDRIFGRFCIGK